MQTWPRLLVVSITGAYGFSCGPRDNYLELYQFAVDAPVVAAGDLIQLSDDFSLRLFSDPNGFGLAALETSTSCDPEQDVQLRLAALVARLNEVFPGLSIDDSASQDTRSTPSEDEKPFDTHGDELPAHGPEPVDSGAPDWLERAGEAVAHGRFKSAERLVHAACSRDDRVSNPSQEARGQASVETKRA